MKFEFSKHAKEQMQARGIARHLVDSVLNNPDRVTLENGIEVYQSVVENGRYLIRIFVNGNRNPSLVVTVYKTSKIDKYQ